MILNAHKSFTPSEVALHNNKKDCWIIVGDGVFDVTPYLHKHPGGAQLILNNAGKDATRDFEGMFHSKGAKLVLERYRIGMLTGRRPTNSLRTFGGPVNQRASSSPSNRTGPYGLGPNPYASGGGGGGGTGPYGLGPNPYASKGGGGGGGGTGPYGLGPNPYAKKSSSPSSTSSPFKKPLPGKGRELSLEEDFVAPSRKSASSPTSRSASSSPPPETLLKFRKLDTPPRPTTKVTKDQPLFVTPPSKKFIFSSKTTNDKKEVASWEEEEDFIDFLFDQEELFREQLLKTFPVEGNGEGRRVELKVKRREQLTHNVFLLDLALPPVNKPPSNFNSPPEEEVDLPPGFHIAISAKVNKEIIKRSYTPLCVRKNQIELLIKYYEKGTLTPMLNGLKEGDNVAVQVPFVTRGILPSKERVHFDVTQNWDSICMIAGGTGITAVYQYLKHALAQEKKEEKEEKKEEEDKKEEEGENKEEGKEKEEKKGEGEEKEEKKEEGKEAGKGNFYLWNCNRTKEDMLLYDELVGLSRDHPKRFHLKMNITQPSDKDNNNKDNNTDDTYSTHYNRFTSSDFQKFFPKPSKMVGILICGPIPFNDLVQKMFVDLGYQFVFTYS